MSTMAPPPLAPTPPALMTAEEFAQRPDPGHAEELVRGRIVDMPPADRKHGFVCLKAGRILGDFVDEHDLGRVMSNDSGVITERGPEQMSSAHPGVDERLHVFEQRDVPRRHGERLPCEIVPRDGRCCHTGRAGGASRRRSPSD
jgi:Uma2 family endonuclease